MNDKHIVIGTRASELALWQAEFVKKLIKRQYPQLTIDLKLITTKGDQILDTALDKIPDKGLFTKELEVALLDGSIDLAVHSLKDLQVNLPDGLILGAITERYSPEDVIISKEKKLSLRKLRRNAVIATGSTRRQAQIRYIRKDIQIEELRGNINTRINKYLNSNWDAIILAKAGVERLGLEEYISAKLDVREMLPAVGQGALAVEIREDNAFAKELLKKLNHQDTEIAVRAERAFLRRLGGGCKNPIAALAKIKGPSILIDGLVATVDGKNYFRSTISGSKMEPEIVGKKLAESVYNMGAKKIMKEIKKIGG
jgi:hydroxymethylbilane synthase